MPTPIMGQPEATAFQLRHFLHSINPSAPDYSSWFITLGRKYGVRGDIAYCQALLETGYWRFGGAVLPTQNNFGGLGATGGGARGVTFPTPQAGIEASIQHLYAYATILPLPANTIQLDPRFQLVNRGIAPNWEDLSGRWATDSSYGQKILDIYSQMMNSTGALTPFPNGDTAPTSPSQPPASGGTTPGSPTSPETPVSTTPRPSTPGGVKLTDIPSDAWYTSYVRQAVELGIMQGKGNRLFDPNAPATRAELAVALVNLYTTLQRTREE